MGRRVQTAALGGNASSTSSPPPTPCVLLGFCRVTRCWPVPRLTPFLVAPCYPRDGSWCVSPARPCSVVVGPARAASLTPPFGRGSLGREGVGRSRDGLPSYVTAPSQLEAHVEILVRRIPRGGRRTGQMDGFARPVPLGMGEAPCASGDARVGVALPVPCVRARRGRQSHTVTEQEGEGGIPIYYPLDW